MSDEPQIIRAIDWRSTFPFTLIFRSFRVAIHPSKLVLALAIVALTFLSGKVLDRLWLLSPSHRAVPGEVTLFEESRTADNPREAFDRERAAEYQALVDRHTMLAAQPGQPPLSDSESKRRFIKERDDEVSRIENAYSKADLKAHPDAVAARDDSIREAFASARGKVMEANAYKGLGLSTTFFNYEIAQLYSIAHALPSFNMMGEASALAALMRLCAIGPIWAVTEHGLYFTIYGLICLTIWSIFAGAIARIAAVHVAREEKIAIRAALAFSMNKFLSFISAPIIPLVIFLVVGIVLAVGGLLGNIPGIGPIIVGGLFVLALIAGFVMSLVLIGTVGGFNLMYPTIAVEGSDSFDAISRSFSYVYARPWRLAFYTLVAAIYGAICYFFVRFFVYLMLWIARGFTAVGFRWYHADNAMPLWSVMWPDPFVTGRLVYHIDWSALGALQSVGAALLAFWIYLTIAMLGAFAISFYLSASTVIYFLMRQEVDATELDDVYVEQTDDEMMSGEAAANVAMDGAPAVASSDSDPAQS